MLPAHRLIPRSVQVRELSPLRDQEWRHLLLQGRPPLGRWPRKPAQVSAQVWDSRQFQITLGAGALKLRQRAKFLRLQGRSHLGLWPRKLYSPPTWERRLFRATLGARARQLLHPSQPERALRVTRGDFLAPIPRYHRKNPSQFICCTRLPLTACKALDKRISASNPYVPPHMLYKCHICCLRITQYMKYLTQHMTKIYTTYDKKLDNIYEFLRQHMTFLTQHMKISCTTHVNNLYNIYKKYTTHDQLLNNIS